MPSQRDRSSDTQGHVGSMDIWHAAETVEMGPDHSNVIIGVNFGRGLPKALRCKGVPPVISLTTSMAHSSSST